MGKNWVALEANPEVLNKFIYFLGGSSQYEFCDVLGFDPELLQMVPPNAVAVLFLFPVDEHYERYRKEQQERIQNEGQVVSNNVYFMVQTIGNACGTIGLLHCVLNNAQALVEEKGFFRNFLNKTKGLTPAQRAEALVEDEEIDGAHSLFASQGQSRAPGADEDVDLHFVAFVKVDGNLYELDGRKPFAVNHGPSESVLEDATRVIQKLVELNPTGDLRFNVMALVPKET
eukprot:Phypoly_transcript_16318.p1 GENE.Phypoly_transcript_16318~~Phypoly_transcript_16318.p1  ORF type:complete len:264 (+),score=44.48 Phypoly_transcript_16318:105-794(+)